MKHSAVLVVSQQKRTVMLHPPIEMPAGRSAEQNRKLAELLAMHFVKLVGRIDRLEGLVLVHGDAAPEEELSVHLAL